MEGPGDPNKKFVTKVGDFPKNVLILSLGEKKKEGRLRGGKGRTTSPTVTGEREQGGKKPKNAEKRRGKKKADENSSRASNK